MVIIDSGTKLSVNYLFR